MHSSRNIAINHVWQQWPRDWLSISCVCASVCTYDTGKLCACLCLSAFKQEAPLGALPQQWKSNGVCVCERCWRLLSLEHRAENTGVGSLGWGNTKACKHHSKGATTRASLRIHPSSSSAVLLTFSTWHFLTWLLTHNFPWLPTSLYSHFLSLKTPRPPQFISFCSLLSIIWITDPVMWWIHHWHHSRCL